MLGACRRVLKPGVKIDFTAIVVAEDLDDGRYEAAIEAGPEHVAVDGPYGELLANVGFEVLGGTDVTRTFREASATLANGWAENERELRTLVGDEQYEERRGHRERRLAAIDDGLLQRHRFIAMAASSARATEPDQLR